MQYIRRHTGKSDMQGGLSWFLVAYLVMLLGVLLGVHVLQPAAEHPAGATKSPARPERAAQVKQAIAVDAVPPASAR
jgi:hypothetical protein